MIQTNISAVKNAVSVKFRVAIENQGNRERSFDYFLLFK